MSKMTFLQNNVKITMFVKEYIKSNFFPFVKKEKYAAYLNKRKIVTISIPIWAYYFRFFYLKWKWYTTIVNSFIIFTENKKREKEKYKLMSSSYVKIISDSF